MPNLELPGNVCHDSKPDFTKLLVSTQFCTNERSWKFEERCTAIIFGTTMVMTVYTPHLIVWIHLRLVSRVSLKYAGVVPNTSTLQVSQCGVGADVHRWEGHRGADANLLSFVLARIPVASRKRCGTESWNNLIARYAPRGPHVEGKENAFTNRHFSQKRKRKFRNWNTSSDDEKRWWNKSTCTTKGDYGQHGTVTLTMEQYKKMYTLFFQKG